MDNHVHWIASGPELSKTMSSLKMFSANQIIKQLREDGRDWVLNQFEFFKKRYKKKSTHQIWQEGFHPVLIQNDEVCRQKMEYIHYNPVSRGYVLEPEHWVYSSARNYVMDDDSLIRVDKELLGI